MSLAGGAVVRVGSGARARRPRAPARARRRGAPRGCSRELPRRPALPEPSEPLADSEPPRRRRSVGQPPAAGRRPRAGRSATDRRTPAIVVRRLVLMTHHRRLVDVLAAGPLPPTSAGTQPTRGPVPRRGRGVCEAGGHGSETGRPRQRSRDAWSWSGAASPASRRPGPCSRRTRRSRCSCSRARTGWAASCAAARSPASRSTWGPSRSSTGDPRGSRWPGPPAWATRWCTPRPRPRRVWSRGALRPLPRSVMGIPADLDGLAESEVLSAEGLARAAQDRDLPATALPDDDVSVGWLIEQRLGREVLDRLVEPLLGGVYAGLRARALAACDAAAGARPAASRPVADAGGCRLAGRGAPDPRRGAGRQHVGGLTGGGPGVRRASAVAWAGCPRPWPTRRQPRPATASRSAPSATVRSLRRTADGLAAGGGPDHGARRRSRPTRSCWRCPPPRPRGCWPRTSRRRPPSWPRWSTPRSPLVTLAFRAADVPAAGGLGLPGAGGRGPAHQGGDLLHDEVGLVGPGAPTASC